MLKKTLFVLFSISILFVTLSCTTAKETSMTSISLEENLQIEGAKGLLSVVIEKPEGFSENETYPVAVVMHGVMASKEYPLVLNISDSLLAEGFVVVRFDFNGHGVSEGDFQDMTVLSEVEDATAVVSYVQELPYAGKINFIGHSQGGAVASILAGELKDQVNSMALFAPAAVLEDQTKTGFVLGIPFDLDNVPEYVEVFGHRVGRAYILEAQNINIYGRAAAYEGPVCLIHGLNDQIVPYEYSEKYNDIYAKSEIHLMEGEDHGFEVNPDASVEYAVSFLVKENF